ncbi:MAG: hypothetical protein ACKPKO_42555, partial [Candidatus Fonsibacter sp.]
IGLAKHELGRFSGSISCCGVRNGVSRPRPSTPYKGLGANNQGGKNSKPSAQYCLGHPTHGRIIRAWLPRKLQPTTTSNGREQPELQWAGNEYELVIMVMNSGVFVNERGTSSTCIGLLTKQDVLDTLQQQPYNNNKVRRLVGGGFLDNIRSGLGWITSKLPKVRGVSENVPHQYAQTGANVQKALGYGKGQRPIDNRLACSISTHTQTSL